MTDFWTTLTSAGPDLDGPDYVDRVDGAIKRLSEGINAYLTDIGGTGNAITATCDAEFHDGLKAGMLFVFRATAANTGAVTLNINGSGAVDVVDLTGAALVSGRIAADSEQLCFFSGHHSKFVLISDTRDTNRVLDYQQFTSSGTWNEPAGTPANAWVRVRGWGAGGGGGSGPRGGGGGGGAYMERIIRADDLASSVSVTVPAGGAVDSAGGNASFGSHLTIYGGGRGGSSSSNGGGGGGGGAGRAGAGTNGGNASSNNGGNGGGGGALGGGGGGGGGANTTGSGGGAGASNTDAEVGGAATSGPSAGESGGQAISGGGAGGGGGGSSQNAGNGARSVWGGGGGGGDSAGGSEGAAGSSLFGGNGGASGAAGSVRGGGGGAGAAGGRGEIEVWVIS